MEHNTEEPPPLPEADLDAWLAQGGDAEDSSDGEDEYAAWLDGALGAARTRLQRAKAEELRLDRRLSGAEESDWSRFVQQKNELMEDVTKEAQKAQAEARAIIDAADLLRRPPPPPTLIKGDFRPPSEIHDDVRRALEACVQAVEFMKVDVKIAPRRPDAELRGAAAEFVVAFWRRRFLLRPKGSLLELEECRRRFAAKRSAYGAWLGVEALSVELKRERALAKDREDAAEACAAAERAAAEREEAARKAEVRRRHIERDAENAARAANDARRMLDLKDACDAEEAAENCRRYLRKVKRAKATSAYTTIAAFVSFRAWRRKRAARKAKREAESIEEACARKTMHLADVESRKLVEFWRVEGMRELRERMNMRDAELYMINIIQTRARAKQAEERRRAALRADAELAKRVARAAAVRLDMLARRRERLNAGDAAVACARAAFSAASDAVGKVADVAGEVGERPAQPRLPVALVRVDGGVERAELVGALGGAAVGVGQRRV